MPVTSITALLTECDRAVDKGADENEDEDACQCGTIQQTSHVDLHIHAIAESRGRLSMEDG